MGHPPAEEMLRRNERSVPERATRAVTVTRPTAGVRRGSVIGKMYRVLELLGAGGMGEVYEVEHLRLARRFAIKFLRGDLAHDRDTAERFSREARAMAILRSEHIVSITDSGETDDGTPFFVM